MLYLCTCSELLFALLNLYNSQLLKLVLICDSICSSTDNKLADVCWQGVENEEEEECQNNQNDQRNDVLLVLFPNEEHKGLHGVHEPVERRLGTA